MNNLSTLSIIIATYGRERVLIETVLALLPLLGANDELILIDQTAQHLPEVQAELHRLASTGRIRWYHRTEPGICRAMNCGACLARNELLLFLDDDIIPSSSLIESHREALQQLGILVTCGQVLQPWNEGPVEEVKDFAEGFHFAYSRSCDIVGLMGGNFGIRRQTFLELGGLDENFVGVAYRWEAEFSYRMFGKTGTKVRFLPNASIRHLQAPSGGTRSLGTKDTWKHITGAVGDYYFAMKCLPIQKAFQHSVTRLFRAPLNRATIRRPWIIPLLFTREIFAWIWACRLLPYRERNYLKPLSTYTFAEPAPICVTPR